MATTETIKYHVSRLSAFLGRQRSTVGVMAMALLVGMGKRMADRFLPIYLLALGGGALSIGLLQSMDNFQPANEPFNGVRFRYHRDHGVRRFRTRHPGTHI